MAEADQEEDDVVSVVEETDRDNGVFCDLPLREQSNGPGEDTEDNQADDSGRAPRVVDTAVLEAEKEHESSTNK